MSATERLVARQIIETLAYSQQFGAVLSKEELKKRLLQISGSRISHSRFGKENTVTEHQFQEILNTLVLKNLIEKNNDFFSLPITQSESKPFFYRQLNLETNDFLRQEKMEQAHKVARKLARIPWIEAIAVTGSVAIGPVKEHDDVDFMIVTQDYRLWLVRPLVTLFAFLSGKRRSWHKEEPNSWCFNIWVERSHLELPKQSKTIYIAYEVCQALFIFDRSRVEATLLSKNAWVKRIVPDFYYQKLRTLPLDYKDTILEKLMLGLVMFLGAFLWPFWETLNYFAYKLQLQYMKSHKTREKVTYHEAFFHPRDSKQLIYNGWEQVLLQWREQVLGK